MDVLNSIVENFMSSGWHLDSEAIAWIIFVLLNFFVLCRTRLLLVFLGWTPLLLTICFYVLRNGIDIGHNRDAFLQDLTVGFDITSTDVASEERLKALQYVLDMHRVVMFDVDDRKDVAVAVEITTTTSSTAENNNISLFERMMEASREKDAKVVLNVRKNTNDIISTIISYVRKHNLYSKVVVTSVHPTIPYLVKKSDHHMLTGFSYSANEITEQLERSNPGNLVFKYFGCFLDKIMSIAVHSFILPRFIGCDMLFMDRRDFSVNLVSSAESSNIKIVAFSVNDYDEKKWIGDLVKVPFFTKNFCNQSASCELLT